jgi:hypothetical protein
MYSNEYTAYINIPDNAEQYSYTFKKQLKKKGYNMNEIDRKNFLLKKLDLQEKDKLYDLLLMTQRFLSIFPNSEYADAVRNMKTEVDKALDKITTESSKRYEDIKHLTFTTWKVSKFDEHNEQIPVMYIYPYDLNRDNCRLFTLCSFINPEYNNLNGLHEQSFDTVEEKLFNKYDLLFEEVSYEEMIEHAKQSCEDAFNERMYKLKYRDHVLD